MYPLSDKFKAAIKYSHVMSTRLDVFKGINLGKSYASDDLSIPGGLLDGEVSIQNSSPRRRLAARFIDTTRVLTPASASDIFTPFGPEIKPYRGIKFSDGTTEMIPLGVFGISDVEVDDAGPGVQISVTAYDRSRKVSRAKPTQDYVIAKNTNYSVAIQALINARVPGLTYNFATTMYLTPQIIIKTGDDPWTAATKMAEAIGCELFFDVLGTCVLRSVPYTPYVDAVWTYAEGAEATILYTNKRITDADTFNYYIVTGEASTNSIPVRADALDLNPFSPTYVFGPYGIVPAPIVSSKLITSASQAFSAAYGYLFKSIGFSERIHFNAIVNAAHEVGDMVKIVRAKSKINDYYALDTLSIPLTKDRAMDAVTRKRQSYT